MPSLDLVSQGWVRADAEIARYKELVDRQLLREVLALPMDERFSRMIRVAAKYRELLDLGMPAWLAQKVAVEKNRPKASRNTPAM